MRSTLVAAFLVAFVGLAAGRVIPSDELLPLNLSLLAFGSEANALPIGIPGIAGDDDEVGEVRPAIDAIWEKSKCRGQRLLLATTLDMEQASRHVTPIVSPWDGDLVHELTTWGYKDDSDTTWNHDQCDFDGYHQLKRAFNALGIDTRSAGPVSGPNFAPGPNRCFAVFHQDGSSVELLPNGEMPVRSQQYYSVNGRRYRSTGAQFTIGVNAASGVIYFILRASPENMAKIVWNTPDTPPRDQLPSLRSSSDIAWGFWNRLSRWNLGNVRKFMAISVVNTETRVIIGRILQTRVPRLDSSPPWPGITFNSFTEEYQALLGSPNGIAVGYFLAQHKRQLGRNKYISKITLFRGDDKFSAPNLLFWVENAPTPAPPPPEDPMKLDPGSLADAAVSHVVKRSPDGRSIVRENVIWAKL